VRRKAKLILLFYRSWAFTSNLATAVSTGVIAMTSILVLPFFVIFKTATSVLVWYVMREYGARRIYYFNNLGLAPRTLWGWSMALDIAIFIICTAAAVTYNLLRE
jgi:hypothetical protein